MKKIINTTQETIELVIGVDHGDRQINHKINLDPGETKTLTDEIADEAVEKEGVEFVKEEKKEKILDKEKKV